MKKCLCFAALLVGTMGIRTQADDVTVKSPDGRITVTVGVETSGRLSYEVRADGRPMLARSPLGIAVDGVDLGQGAAIRGARKVRKIDEKYELCGNHPTIRNRANEQVIDLRTADRPFGLVVRAADDGAAIRYLLPADATNVTGEATAWVLPADAGKVVWSESSACYEGSSYFTAMEAIPEDKPVMGPLSVQVGAYWLALSEADCQTFADMAFKRSGNRFKAVFPAQKSWPLRPDRSREPRVMLDGTMYGQPASPWRYTVVARDLNALVNSDLMTNLCPPPAAGSDFSWVKPGRCLWQWWSVGEPMYDDQKAWFDAAAKLKWEYYLIDDGWRVWKQPGRDQWALLKEVIDYGHSVGVKSIVWVDSKEMRDAASRRTYLEKIKALGADGIKIDFIPAASQEIMQWYLGGMQDCVDLKLLVNFHGSVKPTGLRRTFPNDITREAVRGNEWHMTRYKRVMPPAQNCLLPFARFLAGPADITPVMLDPVQLRSSRFTWANQIAQAVVFLSPVTHFGDQYKFYVGHPAEDLFQDIPVVWDETRVLSCTEVGEVVGLFHALKSMAVRP